MLLKADSICLEMTELSERAIELKASTSAPDKEIYQFFKKKTQAGPGSPEVNKLINETVGMTLIFYRTQYKPDAIASAFQYCKTEFIKLMESKSQ